MKADLLSISILIVFAYFSDTNSLSFKQEPTGTGYYKRRDVVRLFCQLDSTHVDVIWFMNGSPLQHHSTGAGSAKLLRTGGSPLLRSFSRRETNPNRTVHTDYIIERITNGSSLIFAPFRPQANAGVYHCAATDQQSGVTLLSKSVILKKPVGPKQEFEEYMRSVEAISGNNVVLNCTQPVHAEPATYKWRYRKSQILEEFKDIDSDYSELPASKVVTTPNGNLYLYNVSVQFAGDYRCVTVNELLEKEAVTSYYYRLFVRTPKSLRNPVISHFPWFPSTTVEIGQSLTLECNADGAPRPTVAWRFSSSSSANDRQSFGRASQYKHKLHTQHEGILTISNASLEDSGIYACELEPAGSEFIKTVNVTVVPPLSVQVFTHGDDEDGRNVTTSAAVTVGTSLTLRCTTNRAILPNSGAMRVLWLKNGVVLGEEAGGIHQEVYSSGSNLVITNAQLGDSGVYQCFLAEEHAVKNINANLIRNPFGALVSSPNSADYYQPSSGPTGSSNAAGGGGAQQQPLLIYNVHADVFISVTWPATTLEQPKTTTEIITAASKPAQVLSTAAVDDLTLIDAPTVTRVEKHPSTSPGTVDVHWDFKLPSSHRDSVATFSIEFCKILNSKESAKCDKWVVGAVVNATYRNAVFDLMPEQEQQQNSQLPDSSHFVFRVVVKFKAPFFAATSGLLTGNASTQPLLIEPVMPPSELKAMALGSDRIAAVWTDSVQLESLAPDIWEKLWYEVQWRPLGSNNGDSTNVYEVQHFSVRKPVSSIKNAPQKIVPFVVLVDLSATTFYEIRVRYIRIHDSVGPVDPISSWSGIVHAETALPDTPPLLDTYNVAPEALGGAVSALFFPRMYDQSTTSLSTRNNEGLFGSSAELLYTVLGIVMGCLVITLVVFVVLCALRQKRQRKYIQNMRRQLNRMPSKENLNRLLTPAQLAQPGSGQKMRPQFAAASPQGTSLSHHQIRNDENGTPNGHVQFNASQHFQQQIGIYTGSALSSPTAVSAAVAAATAADMSDSILLSDGRFMSNGDRPKLSMVRGNAYGTMSRLSSGPKHINGAAVGPVQSPHVAHNPYYRTLDSHRMFSNGGGLAQNKYNLSNGAIGKNGTPAHMVEQQQPLLSTAESAFIEPPYELPSVVAQQQRLILANQHALAGLGGPPLSTAAASSPASSVAQHYSTYSTFGRKNPLTTTISNRLAGPVANGSNLYFNDGGCPEGVALAEMGVANGIFIGNGGADMSSNRAGPGLPASIKSSSTSPSGTVAMQLGTIAYTAMNSNNQASNGHLHQNGSVAGGPQSTVSGSIALSDQNGEDGNSNFTVDVAGAMGNGVNQRYSGNGPANTRNVPNMSNGLGVTYRPPPQLSFAN